MNTKLIISICLVLVSMIGVGCVSAADNQTSVHTNVEEMNVEMKNEENLIQTQCESVNQLENSANMISSERNFINDNGPFHNGINETGKGPDIKPNLDIKGPKTNGTNLNISGPKNPKLNIKGPKINVTTKIKGPKNNEPKIIKKSKTFDYKGEKVYLAIQENGGNRKLVCYKATSGLNGAGSSYVGEVGMELLEIAEEKGVINKMAYAASWLTVKLTSLFHDGLNEDALIDYMANDGDLSIFF